MISCYNSISFMLVVALFLILLLAAFFMTIVGILANTVIIAAGWLLVYWIIAYISRSISSCKRKIGIWRWTVFDYLSNNTYCFLWRVVAPLLLILYILCLCFHSDDKEKEIWILISQITPIVD